MVDKINFDVDDYEVSDSEEEYTQRERSLISKVRESNRKKVESDEEVLGFSGSDDAESEELSDNEEIKKFEDTASEGEQDDDLPDSRAWGKKKRAYYNTDFVDKDYSQYTQEEEELAAQEYEEAKQIRQRLTKQLNDNDFSLDIFTDTTSKSKSEADTEEPKLKTDLTDLSEREKKQLFKRDAPEFEGLVQDMFNHLEESENILTPFIEYCKKNQVEEIPIIKFVKTFNTLLLNYSNNVSFYLLLKSKRLPIKNHPVVKRLVQVRKLIDQLNERYQDIVRPQLEQFMEDLRNDNVKGIKKVGQESTQKSKKMLNIMKPFEQNNLSDEASDNDDFLESEEPKVKRAKLSEKDDSMDVEQENEEHDGMELDDEEEEEMGKRSITYQMSKNKGLTTRKYKAEQRNPRVKNRSKYRKAVIRRKGSVREVRKETSRYAGEATGIKAFVKRSVTIK
uniref:CSON007543 protein n=1 Tax=Culicoides sonorensis TaxID=179676 RepID=A0A336MZR0_CULSO